MENLLLNGSNMLRIEVWKLRKENSTKLRFAKLRRAVQFAAFYGEQGEFKTENPATNRFFCI
jgi:hypothetical protein